jgi:DNA modification methylase
MYVQHSVEILRELRRVLRPDGVLFWNIGDSYHNGDKGGYRKGWLGLRSEIQKSNMTADIPGSPNRTPQVGLKPKDLCLIPARVALAAQQDGWWVRSEIIWRKIAPMPESVLDRPTRSHESIFLFTKNERYFWNWQEARDPLKASSVSRLVQDIDMQDGSTRANGGTKTNGNMKAARFGGSRKSQINDQTRLASGNEWRQNPSDGANWRDVWDIGHEGFDGAHFAVMPSEVARRCILAGTKVGDTVLDPFAGSGTVGRVAIELNRHAILNDLAYHDLSEKRTKNVQRSLL